MPEISKVTTIHSSSNLTEEESERIIKLLKGKVSPVQVFSSALMARSDVWTFTVNEANVPPYRHKSACGGADVGRCVSLNSGA